jgi:SAM-dependent methyltransferase
MIKSGFVHLLSRSGLLLPAYRSWEYVAGSGAPERVSGPDGLPIPPPRLRNMVVGNTDIEFFVETGQQIEQAFRAALDRVGATLDPDWAILDFGCGCGRVLRRWRNHPGQVCGSDLNAALAKWCQTNLPFAVVGSNGLLPPLGYENESFDLIYAISVFTHLPVDAQIAWRDELNRVMRPGGYLLLTLHCEVYAGLLKDNERRIYDDGGCVVRWPTAAGANICSTFHSAPFVRNTLAKGWEFVEHAPRAVGSPGQDLVVLRKPVCVADALPLEQGLAG